MFIDANDDKWRMHVNEAYTTSQPLSVCFSDEFGNSFLHRVKECMGKPIVLSLSIPFRCFVEETKTNHEKREGFLMVNDYNGMVVAYGLARKWREDFIPLLRKQDVAYLRKKNVLCFLDYGQVYVEFSHNWMIQKEDMAKPIDFPFLAYFGKSPIRYHYTLSNRTSQGIRLEKGVRKKGVDTLYHPLCQNALEKWSNEDVPFLIEGKSDVSCIVQLAQAEKKRAFRSLQNQGFVRKGFTEGEEEVWVLERLPVYTNEDVMYVEKWQCEWLNIPHLVIRKAP